ncbi:MAG TPA: DUF222 domain-containing protein [Sporichthyaceae bacterium]|jgi:hypothetical protein
MSVPLFRADAKTLVDDLVEVLAAPFPAEDCSFSWVAQASSDGLTYLARLERVCSMVAGEQRRVMALQVNLATTDLDPFEEAEQAQWSAYAQIACVLQVACRTADIRIDDARTLYERLPLTLARLRSGHLTVSKAMVLVAETANLDAPECARVEKKALENTKGTRSNFARRVRSAVHRVDPSATARRREQARSERDVRVGEGEDGMIEWFGSLRPEDSAPAWTAVVEHAKTLKVPGDQRSVGALRADAMVDLLVNRPDGTPRVSWAVQVIVPVGTLLGLSDDDGNIPGHGPIPAEVARDLAQQAGECRRMLVHPDTGTLLDATIRRYRPRFTKLTRVPKPGQRAVGDDQRVSMPGFGPLPGEAADLVVRDPEWQRLLTDLDTSARLDAHPDRYRPGDALDRFIRLRDQHCRWPGCRRGAKYCDVDHSTPHGRKGGLTIRRNLACFCRRHHQIKQLPGWKIVQGDYGELTVTTPTGRSYRTRPPNPDGTEPPDEELPDQAR